MVLTCFIIVSLHNRFTHETIFELMEFHVEIEGAWDLC